MRKIFYDPKALTIERKGALIFNITENGQESEGIDAMAIDNSGNVGIGKLNPYSKLEVVGSVRVSEWISAADFIKNSDRRLKRNVKAFQRGLEVISKLEPVTYEKKKSIVDEDYNKSEIGFIAQEIQKVLLQLVSEGKDSDKTLGVDYISLIPILTRAIQEQQNQIEKQSAELADIRNILKISKNSNGRRVSK